MPEIAAITLGMVALLSGTLKLVPWPSELADRVPWTSIMSPTALRSVGWTELVTGLAMIGPTLVQSVLWIVPVAAIVLGVVAAGGAVLHGQSRQWSWSVPSACVAVAGLALATF